MIVDGFLEWRLEKNAYKIYKALDVIHKKCVLYNCGEIIHIKKLEKAGFEFDHHRGEHDIRRRGTYKCIKDTSGGFDTKVGITK